MTRNKLETILRRLRSHPALWGDMGTAKEGQAERLIRRVKARLAPVWQQEHMERVNARFERAHAIDVAINTFGGRS